MNKSQTKKPFLPDDKPRSWVIGVFAAMLGLLFGGIACLGYFNEMFFLFDLGRVGFIVCAIVMFFMLILFNLNLLSGKYRNMESSSWQDRPW